MAIDMSPAYVSVVLEHLPEANIVFDYFHVTKMHNDKLSDLRRALYGKLKADSGKELLKGTR